MLSKQESTEQLRRKIRGEKNRVSDKKRMLEKTFAAKKTKKVFYKKFKSTKVATFGAK